MSFDWSQYFVLAEHLAEQDDEASRRSAVSRAYYAAYCSARNWLQANEPDLGRAPPGESHRYIWDRYQRGPHRIRVRIGAEGNRFRSERNRADYTDAVYHLDRLVETALARARTIFELLHGLDG